MNAAQLMLLLVIAIFLLANGFLYVLYVSIKFAKIVPIETSFYSVDTTRNAKDICVLPAYDFWHPDIKKVMGKRLPKDGCDKTLTPWTELVNSTWRIIKKGATCSARCFEGVDGGSVVTFGDWTSPGEVSCEFLEAVCWEKGKEVYGFIHTQVIPKTLTPPRTLFPDPPSVFVFIIDSMNTGMAKRSFSKFVDYFLDEFEAVEFPYVNKVGENSQANGYALYFGKQIEDGRKVTWEEIVADWNTTEQCETYLDNTTHIFKQFKHYGYTTFSTEDSINSMVDSFPFCKGFSEKTFADHIGRPFSSVNQQYGTDITRRHLDSKHCRAIHEAMMEYLEQAMLAYKDRPLFALSWLQEIAHDYIEGPTQAADYFVEFFKKHKEALNNAFVLFVSDHGLRQGSHMSTEIGAFERNNPYLAISVPQNLRDDETGILEMLKANAKNLQTHYDTRATMLDILMFQPYTKFMDRDLLSMPYEKGNSLIRKQPEFPRTCGTLPIPRQYCICQVEKFRINDEPLRQRLGQKVIDRVHEIFKESNITEICHHYKLDEVPSLLEYGYSNDWNTYEIEVKTKVPSAVHFQTMMTYDEEADSASFGKIVRMDSYGRTADCTKSTGFDYKCNCKDPTAV